MPQARVTSPGAAPQALALAQQHCDAGRYSAAAAICRDVLRANPDWPPALRQLGFVAFKTGDYATATKLTLRAVGRDGANAGYHNDLGVLYRLSGQVDDARREYERAIALSPREPLFYLNLSDMKRFIGDDDPHLAAMQGLLGMAGAFPVASQTNLHFALGKAYQDLGRYDEAFRHLALGNRLKRSETPYDEAGALSALARLRAVFDRALIDAKSGAGFASQLPVFVVGMPRSGSTLVEQILASHPSVHGAGELGDFSVQVERLRGSAGRKIGYPECVRDLSAADLGAIGKAYVFGLRRQAPRAARIVDKALSQFQHLGLIHLALPGARIIHTRRNPLDTCISCFATLFHSGQHFTYELGELGRMYRAYAELMAHWRDVLPAEQLLEVNYETVIADPEAEAKRLVAFCGLDWDPRCLAFHATRRPVTTASAAQVRRPIYQTSRGRWENYRGHLGPLIAALGDLAEP